jgi:lysophospholipase L1-like esterase
MFINKVKMHPFRYFIRLFPITVISFLLIAATYTARKPIIWICGDSTATNNAGWGRKLQSFLDSDKVQVRNKSVGGRSSKSFIEEKSSWPSFKDDIQKGDVLIIQFGHNDNKPHSPERYTIPETTYKEYLTVFIDHAREVGAIPLLASSIVRKRWNKDGTMNPTHGNYPKAMKELAEDKNVAFVDMTRLTKEHFEKIGESATSKLYRDGSHLKANGAEVVTDLLIKSIVQQNIMPICSWVKDSPCEPTANKVLGINTGTYRNLVSYNSMKKTLSINAAGPQQLIVTVVTPNGKSVFSGIFNLHESSVKFEIPLFRLNYGIYFVKSEFNGISHVDLINIVN